MSKRTKAEREGVAASMDDNKKTLFGLFGSQDSAEVPKDPDAPFLPRGAVVIGNYTIQDRVGRGGLSEVYRATSYNNKDFALKIMRPEHVAQTDYVKLLEKEAELRKVQHPAIVEYHLPQQASYEGQAFIFILMDFVDGPTLAGLMKSHGALPASVLITMAERIASGLEAVHARRIYHRDLSPDNIILRNTDPAEAVIIDFGIARDEDSDVSVIGDSFAGKRRYSPPEQFNGIITERTDLYSLGMTLLAAARGSAKALDQRQDNGWPVLEGLQPRLAELIRQLTGPQPGDRLPSASALLEFLHSDAFLALPAPDPIELERTGVTEDDATIIAGATPAPAINTDDVSVVSAMPAAEISKPSPDGSATKQPKSLLPLMIGGGVLVFALVAGGLFLIPMSGPETDPEPVSIAETAGDPAAGNTTAAEPVLSEPIAAELPPLQCADFTGGWADEKAQCYIDNVLIETAAPNSSLNIYPYRPPQPMIPAPIPSLSMGPADINFSFMLTTGGLTPRGHLTVFLVQPWGVVQSIVPRTPAAAKNRDIPLETADRSVGRWEAGQAPETNPVNLVYQRTAVDNQHLERLAPDRFALAKGNLRNFLEVDVQQDFAEAASVQEGSYAIYAVLSDEALFQDPPDEYMLATEFSEVLSEGLRTAGNVSYAVTTFDMEPAAPGLFDTP